MSLFQKLQQRAEENKPILVGMIGIGKFGSMYLAQVPNTPGVEVVGVADLSPSQAKSNLLQVGWEGERLSVDSVDDAISPKVILLPGMMWKWIPALKPIRFARSSKKLFPDALCSFWGLFFEPKESRISIKSNLFQNPSHQVGTP